MDIGAPLRSSTEVRGILCGLGVLQDCSLSYRMYFLFFILPYVLYSYFLGFFAFQRTNTTGTSNADFPLGDPGMYQLDITLKRGQNLAARDRGGKNMLINVVLYVSCKLCFW